MIITAKKSPGEKSPGQYQQGGFTSGRRKFGQPKKGEFGPTGSGCCARKLNRILRRNIRLLIYMGYVALQHHLKIGKAAMQNLHNTIA